VILGGRTSSYHRKMLLIREKEIDGTKRGTERVHLSTWQANIRSMPQFTTHSWGEPLREVGKYTSTPATVLPTGLAPKTGMSTKKLQQGDISQRKVGKLGPICHPL